jgi:hypothetical protein
LFAQKLSRLWKNGAGMEQDRTISKNSIGRQTAAEFFKKQLTTPGCTDIINHVVRHGTDIWGISSAGRALAWHARGHRFDPGILHQKEKHRTETCGAFLLLPNE